MKRKSFEQAAAAAGIAARYINARGETQEIDSDIRQRLLAAMSPARELKPGPLPPCKVFLQKRSLQIKVAGKGDYQWQLVTENGRVYSGSVSAGDAIALPRNLPLGYHQLYLRQASKQWACRIIVAPARCYEPQALLQGEKLWGSCVQLYTVRSRSNWGMGDFGDLAQLITEVAARGGAFIGLNPLHSLYPASPENASPYSPSSRRWLNVLYIDVAAVADFQLSKAAQRWWQQKTTQRRVQQAREIDWVDYPLVADLKLTGLRYAWQQFSLRSADDADRTDFEGFIRQGGGSLFWQGAFDALHGAMLKEDAHRWGWPVWPADLQDVHGEQVQHFCRQHEDEVQFWLWLQWLANRQFDACWQLSQQLEMPLGLYRDLAVGVAEGGAETWCDRELYCLQASVGAPPDILGPQGQNWGLPPADPHVMAARGWQPFIELLRANMASCGALRIDHVMSMLRLWWIPKGETADFGAYVYYPVDDLLAILALESQRHRCMVIGEDLGTVPPEIVAKLRDSGVYSWKVLWFEQENIDTYRSPDAWPRQSMASATTHDLPTLRGFWSAGDLSLGEKLGVYPDRVILRSLYQDRARQKQALLNALHQYGCLPKRSGKRASLMKMTPDLNRAMQRFIADSHSALLGLQPEDWLDMALPVNVPGTTDSYANWRRKLSMTLEEIFADSRINRLLKDLNRRRKARIGQRKQTT
ncbi:4-alpha-glucanotransferase [Erwinia psidii]|uniref:4-alpha-glucanotransferase n=1 Tax=Erwinia psidii TaxID=69224 RepID=A0A3N6SGE9_9GAMM|nr:4-alpha-glucanotransferase [Erwinia psidii]MCX8958852.1 4-alpha-glucanotransferase [Erwinia psidii]MCX8961924.1 4-alpha-glucanotransferase [Erwinia psidii]MCX8966189.1 4-alpha-glucanotransferase [Erwinia psidii]RQM37781.1 4-alpha-glucanotransferase [Erwinia psidii]